MADTLGAVLSAQRRRRFVGRAAEVELFRSALTADEPTCRAIHLHGPGGIGKTSLLEVLASLAVSDGATVVRLDGRELVASPRALLDALGAAVEVPTDGGPLVAPEGRLVLLLDSYERVASLDDWIRTHLLPRLPSTALTVLAGRQAPAPAWRADPAWRELLRVVALRNLDPEESREYLTRCGIDPAHHERVIGLTHGHPLGLSLFADVVARGGRVSEAGLTPDLVGRLLRGYLDVVPEGRQRKALEVCALARVTTEALLRDVLGVDEAHALFTWLRARSFVEAGPEGVFPHDLARDAFDADLLWRDPEQYRRTFRAVASHVFGRLRSLTGRDQQRAIADLKFLFRNLPSVLSPVDWEVWAQPYPDPAAAEDRTAVLELVGAAEGEAAAEIAERWWERQSDGFFVLRGDDDAVRGVICLLDLTMASAADRAADPVARSAWDHAHRHRPPRPGEVVTLCRFVIDRETYQAPSPTLNAVPIVTLQAQLARPELAWDYLTLHEPDPWNDYFALADFHRASDADVEVAGRRYGLFAHDFRQVPVDALVRLWTERALAQDPTFRPEPAASVHVLSHAEFTDAVRQGLRDLLRPELLERNPLLHTRLVRGGRQDEDPDAGALEAVLRDAVASLGHHPRDDKLLRAVERTYVEPAPTQEAAAERLGLPFSTYRRHLTQGVARIVSWLWDREVYGRPSER